MALTTVKYTATDHSKTGTPGGSTSSTVGVAGTGKASDTDVSMEAMPPSVRGCDTKAQTRMNIVREITDVQVHSKVDLFRQLQHNSQNFQRTKGRQENIIGVSSRERNPNILELKRQENIRKRKQKQAKPSATALSMDSYELGVLDKVRKTKIKVKDMEEDAKLAKATTPLLAAPHAKLPPSKEQQPHCAQQPPHTYSPPHAQPTPPTHAHPPPSAQPPSHSQPPLHGQSTPIVQQPPHAQPAPHAEHPPHAQAAPHAKRSPHAQPPLLLTKEKSNSTFSLPLPVKRMSSQHRKSRTSKFLEYRKCKSIQGLEGDKAEFQTLVSSRRKTWSDFVKPQSRFKRQGDAKAYFRRMARQVLLINNCTRSFESGSKSLEDELKTFIDIARELEDMQGAGAIMEKAGISFNHKDYAAKRDVKVTSEMKQTLTLPTEVRSDEMIQRVITGLQCIKSFSEYPIDMQEKLAKVAWYSEVTARRLILREGHVGENFYFIVSGKALVKKIMKNPETGAAQMNIVARLKQGSSFGEIALIHHSKRTASVESETHMKLLVITRKDFHDIFFSVEPGEEPDHIKFCRQLQWMKGFPFELFNVHPGNIMMHFYKRGTVVVADSTQNNWIYIVKSGLCSVLRRLRAVTPRKNLKAEPKLNSITFPRLGTTGPECRVDCGAPRRRSIRTATPIERARTAFFSTQTKMRSHEAQDSLPPVPPSTALTLNFDLGNKAYDIDPHHNEDQVAVQIIEEGESEDDDTLKKSLCQSMLKNTYTEPQNRTKLKAEVCHSPSKPITGYSKSRLSGFLPQLADSHLRPMLSAQKTGNLSKSQSERPTEEQPRAQTPSCFIRLRELRTGQAFGLEDIQFDQEGLGLHTSVSLVSDGAELIMLSKSFLRKYADEHVIRKVNANVQQYPDVDTLQDKLQNEANWRMYREETVVDHLWSRKRAARGIPSPPAGLAKSAQVL